MNLRVLLFLVSFFLTHMQLIRSKNRLGSNLSSIAQQIAQNTYQMRYSMTTNEGYNMDCLKVIYRGKQSQLGVFHSSKGQSDPYNRLYAATRFNENQGFSILTKVSERGSQGTILNLQILGQAYLVAYQLQNHQHGNTFALRYYQNYEHLTVNDFLYEYQLQQKIDFKQVRNIGTPSFQSIQLVKTQNDPKFNQYSVKVKFHYSPDGSHDLPGFGMIALNPLRDFVQKSGKWIGGCKENYSDWKGSSDQNVIRAMLRIGVTGKIGQRDSFAIQKQGKIMRYYLYEANLYSDFDWKNWRIFLYGQSQNQVTPIPFVLDKVIDLANPHISIQAIQGSTITLQMSFFLPSEGMQPLSAATAGQVMVKTKLTF